MDDKGGGWRSKMHGLNSKFAESAFFEKATHIKHKIGKLENIVNPNHRHDEEHEKITDEKRAAVARAHRFGSFAPERDGNKIKWYIDGRDYYYAVSVALERAKETIYIADWWLSPELFLRRPPATNREWRLDECLKRAAERGVEIFIIVYKEVEAAVSCNSNHTKKALRALCPPGTKGHGKIHVMRHPDHNVFENLGDMTFYFAHHEKFIVLDFELAFIGGLDLCFGRWDTRQHPLADVSPRGVKHTTFPGQDFNNNRIMDFKGVDDWKNNELSKADYGRMPWHDVSMGVIGPCVYDIAEHFALRWNFVKRDKYKRDPRFDWICLEGRTGEHEDLIGVQRPKFPVGKYLEHPLQPLETKPLKADQGTVKAQVVRSSADWSSGILNEDSIQTAYKELIRNAQHLVHIENQFFITATGDQQHPVLNTIGEAIVDAISRAAKENRKFRIIVIIPAIPGFAGDLRSKAAAGTRAIMDYQYKSIHRGEHSIYGRLRAQNIDAEKYIFFFNLRSYDRINKTPAMTEQEEISGVPFQDVQRAHAEELMPEGVHGVGNAARDKKDHRHGQAKNSDDEAEMDPKEKQKSEEETKRLKAARQKFEDAAEKVGLAKFNDVDGDRVADSKDSIAENAMLNMEPVSDELWNKEHPETELENFIQEELYIHDKLLIVDDRYVICGSSNINDRSQLGYHDSELSIVMEDTNTFDSTMNGQPYKARHHAATLRRMLWREHMGLLPPQELDASKDPNAQPPGDCANDIHDSGENQKWFEFVADPLNDEVWEMWTSRATTNTEVFRHLFHADPDNCIKNYEEYDEFLPKEGESKSGAGAEEKWWRKQGHLHDPTMSVETVKKELDRIKGHLVWYPLHFLEDVNMAERNIAFNSMTESIYT